MVAKLIAIEGPEKGLELVLEKGDIWIIGRDAKSCQFVLSDPKVSRKHAQIRRDKNQFYIKNLSKTNMILIGESPLLSEAPLSFNEKIKIGDSWFRFSEVSFSNHKKTQAKDDFDQLFDDGFEDSSQELVSSQEEEKNPEPEPENSSLDDHESNYYDTIFKDVGNDEFFGELSDQYMSSERFILKVLSGPNTGAEFAMQKSRSYIIGTDVSGADIIFNDLSVSRHHARLSITDDAEIFVEDLDSRNGVIVDGSQIEGQTQVSSQNMITLGTTTFIVIDREAGEHTVLSEPIEIESQVPEKQPEPKKAEPVGKEAKKAAPFAIIKESTFIITGILIAVVLVLGIGSVMLFKSSPVRLPHRDYTKDINLAIGDNFQDVKFTFNDNSGTLFMVGHVLTTVDKEELLYTLNNLPFISQIDDNVVTDETVWQEMNLVLERNPNWRGINIHSPKAGRFIISGYLPTREAAAELTDFINLQFPYVDRLTNHLVIEEDLYQEVTSKLHNYGFYNVQVEITNGDIALTGYVNLIYDKAYQKILKEVSRIMGVRSVNNYTVMVGKRPIPAEHADHKKKTAQNQMRNKQKPSRREALVKALKALKSTGAPGAIGQPGQAIESAEKTEKRFKDWFHDPLVIDLTNYITINARQQQQSYEVTGYAEQGTIGRAVEVNGKILTVGDQLDGMTVVGILDGSVFLEKSGMKYKIEINR